MELRMLSGLHRGAALELGSEELLLGASHEADIILADPGIEPIHLRVIKRESFHELCPAEGQVIAESGEVLQGPVEIVLGSRYRIGEIWIGFFNADDAWVEVLPTAVEPFVPAPAPVPEEPQVAPEEPHKSWRERITGHWNEIKSSKVKMAGAGALVLAFLMMLVWGGVLIYSTFFAAPPVRYQAAGPKSNATAIFGTGTEADEKGRARSREKYVSELRRMLAERDLLDRLDIVTGEDVWEIRGSLDSEEQGRLERTLGNFNKTYQPPFGIRASVVPVKDMLPFKIVQVTTGKYGNVVTDGGQRLFVGDMLDGYKLVLVDRSKLVFSGKMRIEFAW